MDSVRRDLLAAWISGDIDKLHELINDMLWLLDEPVDVNHDDDIELYAQAITEYFQILIVYRNHMWLPRIEAMISDDRQYFVAVCEISVQYR